MFVLSKLMFKYVEFTFSQYKCFRSAKKGIVFDKRNTKVILNERVI